MTQIEVLREITMDPLQPHTNVLTFWRNEVGWTRDTTLHGIISQKAVFFTATTMKPSIWQKDNNCDRDGVWWRFTHVVTCQLPISSGQIIMKRGTGVKCLSPALTSPTLLIETKIKFYIMLANLSQATWYHIPDYTKLHKVQCILQYVKHKPMCF